MQGSLTSIFSATAIKLIESCSQVLEMDKLMISRGAVDVFLRRLFEVHLARITDKPILFSEHMVIMYVSKGLENIDKPEINKKIPIKGRKNVLAQKFSY